MRCMKCELYAMRATVLDRPTRRMHAGAACMSACTVVVGALAGRVPRAIGAQAAAREGFFLLQSSYWPRSSILCRSTII